MRRTATSATYGLTALCLLTAGSLPVTAAAQDGQTGAQEAGDFFQLADQDADGVLQPAEYERVSVGFTHEEVAGQDGRLERADYLKAFAENVYLSQESLALLDLDKNGSLSQQEYEASTLDQEFDGIDVNRDGKIGTAELSRTLAWVAGQEAREPAGPQASAGAPAAVEQAEQQVQALEARVRADAGQFAGMPVKSGQGEVVGEVEDMVQAVSDGRLFAIINTGSAAEERVALPLEQLKPEAEGLSLELTNPAQILPQHSYNEQDFEPLEQPHTQPATAEADSSLQSRARLQPTQLQGRRIVLEGGETVGTVEQVLMKADAEDLYVMTSAEGFAEGGSRVVIALEDLRPEGDDLILRQREAVMSYQEEGYLVVQEPDIAAEAD